MDGGGTACAGMKRMNDLSRLSLRSHRGVVVSQVARRLLQSKPRPRSTSNNNAATTTPARRDLATTSITLDFEGVGNFNLVEGYYSGMDGGPNYGVLFGSSFVALVDSDEDGNGAFANEPSPSTALFFYDDVDPTVSVPAGFAALSFQYTSYNDATLTVFDGVAGSGTVLATGLVPRTGFCDDDTDPGDFPYCGDPTGFLGVWLNYSLPFPGRAKSIRFSGVPEDIGVVIDDMVFVQDVTPSCTKTTYWLWNPTTNAPVGELLNNSASCIAVPYNIEVRPCTPPRTTPVFISLKNATTNGVIFNQNEFVAPFYLWGDKPATGDVLKNTKPLPKGAYYLDSRVDGAFERIQFTKTC
jgi:hypothetical protein